MASSTSPIPSDFPLPSPTSADNYNTPINYPLSSPTSNNYTFNPINLASNSNTNNSNTKIKDISFSNRIVIASKGNILPNCLIFNDIDNDSNNELILGTISGELCIYKFNMIYPYMICSNLGTISCITYTSLPLICNTCLIVITVEGKCYLFDPSLINRDLNTNTNNELYDNFYVDKSSTAPPIKIQPCFTFTVPCNITAATVADINNDGILELILGSSSKVLYIFIFSPIFNGIETNQLSDIPEGNEKSERNTPYGTPILTPEHSFKMRSSFSSPYKTREMALLKPVNYVRKNNENGNLVGVGLELYESIPDVPASIQTLSFLSLTPPYLLIGTDCGKIFFTWPTNGHFKFADKLGIIISHYLLNVATSVPCTPTKNTPSSSPTKDLFITPTKLERNDSANISLPSPDKNSQQNTSLPCLTLALPAPYIYATLTPLGELTVVSETGKKEKQLIGDMFGFISKLDLDTNSTTNLNSNKFRDDTPRNSLKYDNGNNLFGNFMVKKSDNALTPKSSDDFLLVLTCWDGTTYLMPPDLSHSYRFLPEPIACRTQTCVAGKYSLKSGESCSVLAYSTFSDTILLYYDLEFPGDKQTWIDKKEEVLKNNELSKNAKNLSRMNSNQLSMLLAADVDLLTKYRDFLKNKDVVK